MLSFLATNLEVTGGMSSVKKTIKDIDISGKKLLIRVDYSVELDEKGEVAEDFKLRVTLPTIKYALEHGAAVILCSHMGRPDGRSRPDLSLFPVAKRLRELLGKNIEFIPETTGERARKAAQNLQPGRVMLLENLRFHPGEEANDPEFAKQLAGYADVFVQDGFAVSYRRHATVEAVTHHLPSVAGLLVQKEMAWLGCVFGANKTAPVVAVIGGESVREKTALIERAIQGADVLVVGGKLGVVFMHALGVKTGKTPFRREDLSLAKTLIDRVMAERERRPFMFYVPADAVVARSDQSDTSTRIVDWSAHAVAEVEAYPLRPKREDSEVADDEMILDIGPFSGAFIAGLAQFAGTMLWDGAVGESAVRGLRGPVGPFAHGSELVVEAMTGQYGRKPLRTVVSGDDAVNYVLSKKVRRGFSHVSSGGGASQEVLSGRPLIGYVALEDK